jgi:hypothetical protein
MNKKGGEFVFLDLSTVHATLTILQLSYINFLPFFAWICAVFFWMLHTSFDDFLLIRQAKGGDVGNSWPQM